MSTTSYDAVIVGGGVTGTAALFTLSRYTNLRRLLMVERRHAVAQVNSNVVNNSQTLHSGEIETNYDLKSALKVRAGADLVAGFIERHAPDICLRIHKMVLGVGEAEAASIAGRYDAFLPEFPDIRLLGREELAAVEPAVVEGRPADEKIVALHSDRGYAVDYRRLSEAFVRVAKGGGAEIDFCFHLAVDAIERREGGGFVVRMGGDEVHARTVIVAAGSPSLVFAQALGYGREYAILPVAGSFYRTRDLLKGKVYTVQNPKIPFAAVHGDPAVYDRKETRFGPTARPMPILERHHYATFFEFMRTGTATPRGLWAALRVAGDWDISRFLIKNALYDVPFVGKRVFLRDARKIVPSLTAKDLTIDRGAGGIRGQLVDKRAGKIARGHDKIVGDGIIFIMAPSPGASYCLGNAVEDARTLGTFLGDGYRFDEVGLRKDLAVAAVRDASPSSEALR
ncbi:MAG TPA: FAD-dependent oxidoreductase [Candidatus Binatia bacterium]|nr:FAD-dependent oxidoreductase [Candidatus Binatia bacterium]